MQASANVVRQVSADEPHSLSSMRAGSEAVAGESLEALLTAAWYVCVCTNMYVYVRVCT